MSEYKPAIKEAETLTLEDDSEDFTKTSFIDCSLNGDILPIRQGEDWINAFIGIMNIEYAYLKSSTAAKIGILKDVFNELEIDLDSLVIHIRRIGNNE